MQIREFRIAAKPVLEQGLENPAFFSIGRMHLSDQEKLIRRRQ
jgi:hypothetical protein